MARPTLEYRNMPNIEPDDLLTAAELAERLRVKPKTVLGWYRKGRIPGRKLSPKLLRFDLAEVVAALEAENKPRPTLHNGHHRANGQGVAR